MDICQQNTLADLTWSASGDPDLPTLLHDAVTLVRNTLDVEHSAIWAFLPDYTTLLLQASNSWPAERVGQTQIDRDMVADILGDISSGRCLNGYRPDCCQQPVFLHDQGIHSSMVVLIPGSLHPFGIFCVGSVLPRRFTPAERDFLHGFTRMLALAIEHLQSEQLIRQQVEQRTHEIEQRLIATAQERAVLEERQRLARDLHDSVTQALYGITLHGQTARRLLELGEKTGAIDSLRILQDTAQEALDEMRLLIFELRPPVLEQVGLAAALQARLNAVEGRANLQTRLIADDLDAIPAEVEQALYRIAQEALNNALRHAHARRITVVLRQAQSRLIMEIIDDGDGFDPGLVRDTGGVGMQGIAERVARLDGIFTLETALGAGTQLHVEIPYETNPCISG